MNAHVISCPVCQARWRDRDAFLSDPAVRLTGYQPDFEELHLGLFLFYHAPCGNTLAIPAGTFHDLRNGPMFERRLPGGGDCPGHCQHRGNFDTCPVQCECNYVREVLLELKGRMAGETGREPGGDGPLNA